MSWVRRTTTYQVIETRRKHSGKCPVCGVRTQRQQVFTQTVNPFNRNPDGTVRSPMEIRQSVEADADAWVPDFRHEACRR